MTLTKEQLDGIEQRARKATPGPWNRIKSLGSRFWTLGTIRSHTAYPLPESNEDADWSFVEHARADVPALVARVRELEGALRLIEPAIKAHSVLSHVNCSHCAEVIRIARAALEPR